MSVIQPLNAAQASPAHFDMALDCLVAFNSVQPQRVAFSSVRTPSILHLSVV